MDKNQRDYFRREAEYTRVKQVVGIVIVLVLLATIMFSGK